MTNFKETKVAIEKMFYDNWYDTPIHYAGVEFDATDIDKWVNPVYEPDSILNTSMSGTSIVSTGAMYIVCWASNQFDAFELADTVTTMIGSNMPDDISTIRSSMIDQGFDPSGKAFVVIRYNIKSYIAVC